MIMKFILCIASKIRNCIFVFMKLLVFISCLTLIQLTAFSQKELIIDGRPTSIGYCNSSGNVCKDEITSIISNDVSAYLIRISFKQDESIRLKLYRNGDLIEEFFSDGFSKVKNTKNVFFVSCKYFKCS